MGFISSMSSYSSLGTKGSKWNNATGGTITTFTSSGQSGTITGAIYRVHTFLSTGTFTILNNTNPFDRFIVGGGGGGVQSATPSGGDGGSGGVVQQSLATTLSLGNHAATVGVGGNGANFSGLNASDGGASSLDAIVSNGGTRGLGQSTSTGSNGTNAGAYTISGVSVSYGFGAPCNTTAGTNGTGNGGGGGASGGNTGQKGGDGTVIIRYRIA